MVENTKIEWADHTFNPWVGCTRISPACDHCYAESWARRIGKAGLWEDGERHRTSAANWKLPLKWNRQAQEAGTRARVFCASLADVFDNVVPDEWRADLWKLIAATPHLDWLLLTKRISNAARMGMTALDNVWLGATIANQEEADRDIPKLLEVPARVRFLSMEPLLGPVDLRVHEGQHGREGFMYGVDWVIVGGESGAHARPMHPDWARSLRDQCAAAGVPFFFKQWGEWLPISTDSPCVRFDGLESFVRIDGKEYRGDAVRIEEADTFVRMGKKATGRSLDGRIHGELPR